MLLIQAELLFCFLATLKILLEKADLLVDIAGLLQELVVHLSDTRLLLVKFLTVSSLQRFHVGLMQVLLLFLILSLLSIDITFL